MTPNPSKEQLSAYYEACREEQIAQAFAYQLAARRARLSPWMSPELREREAQRLETFACACKDRAQETAELEAA